METCGIVWIQYNEYNIFKSMHKNIVSNLFLFFSFSKGLEMPSNDITMYNGYSNLLLNNIICHGKIVNIFYHNKNHEF
jgi:hypothetical protein